MTASWKGKERRNQLNHEVQVLLIHVDTPPYITLICCTFSINFESINLNRSVSTNQTRCFEAFIYLVGGSHFLLIAHNIKTSSNQKAKREAQRFMHYLYPLFSNSCRHLSSYIKILTMYRSCIVLFTILASSNAFSVPPAFRVSNLSRCVFPRIIDFYFRELTFPLFFSLLLPHLP